MMRHRLVPTFAVLTVSLATLCFGGCVEERVVHRRPMLGGLPGAVTGGVVTAPRVRGRGLTGDGPAVEPRSVDEDGNTVLRATTMQHLVQHVRQTVFDDERELFETYVLSQRTRDDFIAADRDPQEIFTALRNNQRALLGLLSQFPSGEFTPGVRMQRLEDKIYRLEVPAMLRRNMSWTRFDAVLEGGEFKFRWIW